MSLIACFSASRPHKIDDKWRVEHHTNQDSFGLKFSASAKHGACHRSKLKICDEPLIGNPPRSFGQSGDSLGVEYAQNRGTILKRAELIAVQICDVREGPKSLKN